MNRHSSEHPGEKIQAAREAMGLSRIGLAYKAGVDLRTIARIEGGEVRFPHRATLKAIFSVLSAEATAA